MRAVLQGMVWLGICLWGLTTDAQVSAQNKGTVCDDAGVCTLPQKEDTPAVVQTEERHFWANRYLLTEAPELKVAKWLTDIPEMKEKFLVIEFWRTWCGACKRGTALMNRLQKKYGNELVVIGITGEPEAVVKTYKGPEKKYFLALDRPKAQPDKTEGGGQASSDVQPASDGGPDVVTGIILLDQGQGAYEAHFGVWGWPHVVIIEPRLRIVVWEGFPGSKGFELTEGIIEKLLAINRAQQAEPVR